MICYAGLVTSPAPRIRLIWDFFGPNAERTAQHHQKHLDEFAAREQVTAAASGAEPGNPGHWTAWLVVDASDVERVRQALRPQRGLEA
jgi:hypothetical protein